MSSAFIYIAIVAIWAFVLVPRWLRRAHAQREPLAGEQADLQDPEDDGTGVPRAVDSGTAPDGAPHSAPASGSAGPPDQAESGSPTATPRQPAPPQARSRAVRARRRLLILLVLLCAAAAEFSFLKVTSWWACAPPAGMLALYLPLLRAAALADAEQARRRAALELRAQAAHRRADAATQPASEGQSAEIIDISARVGDQLYDQYADAAIRAVGD